MAIEWKGRDVTPWVVGGGVVFVLVSALAFLVGISFYWDWTGTGVADVNELIDAHIADGATTEDTIAFLDSNRIEHDALRRAADCPYGIFPGLSPEGDAPAICGIIRSASHGLLGDTDLYLYFVFGSDQRLTGYKVISACLCGF